MERAAAASATILVVEDDLGIANLLRRHLERAGFRAETAGSASEARDKLKLLHVDLLILDYQLGDQFTGLELYRSLQRDGCELPAILVTGVSDEQRLVEALRAGVRDYILKTPNFVDLVAPTVERVMQQVRGERQLIEAEAASRAKDNFLATLSHELRTPLTPVLALVSALQDDERLPADLKDDLKTIHRNIELEARLIDDLLDVTRITRGKLELRTEIVDVRPLIAHAVKTCCDHEALDKGIVCEQHLTEEPLFVHADPARLTQVLWNLLKNAIKFTPAGGRITIQSRCETTEGSPGELVIEVADTGLGIEPEVLPRIFGAFEQGHRGITRQYGGLGLGLAISKAIVDLHRGSIQARSEGRNQGSKFTLRLPLAAQKAAPASQHSPGARANGQVARGAAAHLLLVEDHHDSANVLARMLRRSGYEVTLARSVQQAVAAVEAAQQSANADAGLRPIELVISDLGLPDGSGTELMRVLRDRYQLTGIALSGFGMDEDVQRAHASGFACHLTKPVAIDGLLGVVHELLEAEPART